MISYLIKQVLKKYKPAVVAVLSSDSDLDPSVAIVTALSNQFIVSESKSAIRTREDATGAILNAAGKSSVEQFFMALALVGKKRARWPEIIVLNIRGNEGLQNLEEFSEFLKFDFAVALPNQDKTVFLPENAKKFMKKGSRIVVKSTDKNAIPQDFKKNYKVLTFLSKASDIFPSDMVLQSNGGIKGIVRFGISFKINYKGTVLPVRINRSINEREVCNILIATLVGVELGMNLVEVTSSFQKYNPVNEMAIVEGIKHSAIIDDSANCSLDSAFSALKSLPKLKSGRKLIVLGDILGMGFEAENKHREIAKYILAAKPDLVFCVGNRVNFTVDEMRRSRFPAERIFKFGGASEVEKVLQPKIKEDDLILVVGSKEMGLKKVVEQVMANPAPAILNPIHSEAV